MAEWLTLRFSLDGVETLSRALVDVAQKLEDFTEPLTESSKLLLDDIHSNFTSEGGLVGGWAPLKPSTIQTRLREGFGAGPILNRTGRYSRSFKADISKNRMVIDAWGIKYHKYHQSAAPRSKLPRRPTLFLREPMKAEIIRKFQEYVKFNV